MTNEEMEIIIALVFIIILFVCSIVTFIENEILEDTDFTRTILCIFTGCSLIAMLLIIAYLCKPKAIDVYRDKTTLEITYKNNVPIDTVVVWKGK